MANDVNDIMPDEVERDIDDTPGDVNSSQDNYPSTSIQIPEIDYEILESRSKFTAFKITVVTDDGRQWYIYRRYTDFRRMHDKLKTKCQNLPLLPPKAWFVKNFDHNFLEERRDGLFTYLTGLLSLPNISKFDAFFEFLCLNEPPNPSNLPSCDRQDSVSSMPRCQCESLEETVSALKEELVDRTDDVMQLKEENQSLKEQVNSLMVALRLERNYFRKKLDEITSMRPHVARPPSCPLNFHPSGETGHSPEVDTDRCLTCSLDNLSSSLAHHSET